MSDFIFGGRSKFIHDVDSLFQDTDLYSYLTAQGYVGQQDVYVNINTRLYPTSTTHPGLNIIKNSFPAGTRIYLTINSEITGRGGGQGEGGSAGIEVTAGPQVLLIINNLSEINGGGGGGSWTTAGGSCNNCASFDKDGNCTSCLGTLCQCTSGSGGTGYGPDAATSGSNGTSCSCTGFCGSCSGGTGYPGGGKGADGDDTAGNAGSGGNAITGNSNVDAWINTGTRNGDIA